MVTVSIPTDRLLTRDMIAKRVAADLQPGWVVNLGVGMPTLTTKYITPQQGIIFHSENGIIGLVIAAQAFWIYTTDKNHRKTQKKCRNQFFFEFWPLGTY